jgi:hypothetical protein
MIYKNIDECINNIKFSCFVYEDFIERIPRYFRDFPERQAFYTLGGQGLTKLTIADMIDLHARECQFVIETPESVIQIYNYLESYLSQAVAINTALADSRSPEHMEIVSFITKAKDLLNTLSVIKNSSDRAVKIKAKQDPDKKETNIVNVLETLSRIM